MLKRLFGRRPKRQYDDRDHAQATKSLEQAKGFVAHIR